MIVVDTSALVALLRKEIGWESIETIMRRERCTIPAPVVLEFLTVTRGKYAVANERANTFLKLLLQDSNIRSAAFEEDDAVLSSTAARIYGKGRGHRAQLNIVDLMVYGIAKRLGAPILCTGRDFAATDIAVHPASRLDGQRQT